jgi:hypothetical protein
VEIADETLTGWVVTDIMQIKVSPDLSSSRRSATSPACT